MVPKRASLIRLPLKTCVSLMPKLTQLFFVSLAKPVSRMARGALLLGITLSEWLKRANSESFDEKRWSIRAEYWSRSIAALYDPANVRGPNGPFGLFGLGYALRMLCTSGSTG